MKDNLQNNVNQNEEVSEEKVEQTQLADNDDAQLQECRKEVDKIMSKHGYSRMRKVKVLLTDSSNEYGAKMGDQLVNAVYYDDNPDKGKAEAMADEYIINVDNFDKTLTGAAAKGRPLYRLMNEMDELEEEVFRKQKELCEKKEEIRKHISEWYKAQSMKAENQ